MAQPTLQDVLDLAQQLSPADRSRLIQEVVRLPSALPSRSQYGALAHLGPAPSMEDFDAARRELSADFGLGVEDT
jgi:hypothetical protein